MADLQSRQEAYERKGVFALRGELRTSDLFNEDGTQRAETETYSLFTIPRGAIVMGVSINVDTAFADSMMFRLGTASDNDKISGDVDVTSVGEKVAAYAAPNHFADQEEIVATVSHDNTVTRSNGGVVIVTLLVAEPNYGTTLKVAP